MSFCETTMNIIQLLPIQGNGISSALKSECAASVQNIYSPTIRYGRDGLTREAWALRMEGWLRTLIDPEYWVELRALNVPCPDGNRTQAGIFAGSALDELVRQALDVGQYASGVYFTLNPVSTDCNRPCDNTVRVVIGGQSINDAQIAKRRWLLVDFDPIAAANHCELVDQGIEQGAELFGLFQGEFLADFLSNPDAQAHIVLNGR